MRRLLLLVLAGLFLFFTSVVPASAAEVPTDLRVTAAVAAWKSTPLYVDPQYGSMDTKGVVERLASAEVPVYVAVLPTGAWFQEKGDTVRLAGWLAVSNGKPGLYLVVDDSTVIGATHLIAASSPGTTYAARDESLAGQVGDYLDATTVNDRYEKKPARTAARPPTSEPSYERDNRFTAKSAIGNSLGGLTLGLLGGAILATPVLGLAALIAHRRGGRL
ncbi:hypothetical protein [Streptomyces sp. SID13031]|uniref:hypothetical protein n=1 Tax=Streptomyces sp. SID13031 TaxID=2706046 RepID=UPI0013CB221B|nr:hypothetical protein [Streptomyces sp. SID13031]NEA36107.1 hypothetical protein [Streptomyces sp. SID13031]